MLNTWVCSDTALRYLSNTYVPLNNPLFLPIPADELVLDAM